MSFQPARPAAARPRSARAPRSARRALRRVLVGTLLGACLVVGWPQHAPSGDPPADLSLVRKRLTAREASRRAAAVRRLRFASGRVAWRLVRDTLEDPNPYVRRAAAEVAAAMPLPRERAVRDLQRLKRARARASAAHAMVQWGGPHALRALHAFTRDREPTVREAAWDALVAVVVSRDAGGARTEDSADDRVGLAARVRSGLARAASDRDAAVRARVLDHLRARWPDALPASAWLAALRDRDARVRLVALEGSVAAEDDTAVVAVLRGSQDAVWTIQLVAAELAGAIRDERIVRRLIAWLGARALRARVRDAVHGALVRLTGIPFGRDSARWVQWLEAQGAKPLLPEGEEPGAAAQVFEHEAHTVEGARFLGVPIISSRVAFVLDASGSMGDLGPEGTRRHDVARDALGATLSRLIRSREVRVQVHRFATHVESFSKGPVPARRGTVRKLLAWIDARQPAGRTALYDGIARALNEPEIDQVVVLSDGAPSAGTWFTKLDLLEGVRRANRYRRARIDVIAIGAERVAKRWRDVLQRIALEHGGSYHAHP